MNKTYRRIVFGGKEAVWNGIDQGKHPLYPNALNFSLNATFTDNVFKVRDGQENVSYSTTGAVLSAQNTGNNLALNVGTDIYLEPR